jgi:PAT family beta-lactamase induction signal transducer AmpG
MSGSAENPPAIPTSLSETGRVSRSPWSWIPTLYLAEGLPYAVVMFVAGIMYKNLGLSNTDITFYTTWLYLPWVIKPFWSPVVDILKTRRLWIWTIQLLIGAGLAGVALSVPTSNFFKYSLAFFWLLAFSSATHDIAADGFYMLALPEKEQSFFVGIRSTFYRISLLSGQGLLVILAGLIQAHTGLPKVELQVAAVPDAPMVQTVESAVAPFIPSSHPSQSELHIVAESEKLEIRPEPHNAKDIKELIAKAKSRNTQLGFYGPEEKPKEDWLSRCFRFLGTPFRALGAILEPWLRDHFGATRIKSDLAGNIGILQLQLSKDPGTDTIVTLALRSGDKSISVAEGARLVFNADNWNKPALVVFQLDPKLRTASSAIYELRSGNIRLSWCVTFAVLFSLFLFFAIYHRVMLPRPPADRPGTSDNLAGFFGEFLRTFVVFFRKDRIGVLLLFLLLFRFGEAQLVTMVKLFLLDGRDAGGLGLTTGAVGFVYGTVGVIALTCGGLLGGMLASRHGLRSWFWPMVFVMHLPDAVFVYLAYAQPDNFYLINICVAIEQFGYGFGFTAYMLYMLYIARGQHQTAHYAICTGFMALSMMLPGMFSGWLQDIIGYQHFFVWVMLATIPSFIVAALVPLEAGFGKKTSA